MKYPSQVRALALIGAAYVFWLMLRPSKASAAPAPVRLPETVVTPDEPSDFGWAVSCVGDTCRELSPEEWTRLHPEDPWGQPAGGGSVQPVR